MAKYYTKLKLEVSDMVDISLIRYDVTVTYKSLSAKPTSSKPHSLGKNRRFSNNGLSEKHNLSNRGVEEVRYYIKDIKGKPIKDITANPLSKEGRASRYKLKTTPASLKRDPKNNKIVGVDNTEVAWYLVKKQESIESFLTRAYKYTPTKLEENIFRANNPHLIGTPVLTLQPGDVVILSNSSHSSNTELQKMKKYAKDAKNKIEKMKREKGFNPELFVYLSDLTTSTLSDADFVGVSSNPVPTEITNDNKDSDKTLLDYFADGSSAVITFSSQTNKDTLKNFGTLVSNYNEAQGTKSGNSKHFSQFRTDNAKIYKALNNKLSLRFLKWDQGVRTDKLSKSIKSEMKRSTSFNGGLDAYVNNMEKNGKVTKTLKLGGNLVVGYNAFKGSKEIHDAYKSKNSDKLHKAVAIEPLKLSGSVIGAEYGAAQGAVVGAIIVGFTVGTGGIGGVVIIGLSAVIGGVGGGLLGGSLGEIAGNIVYENTRN